MLINLAVIQSTCEEKSSRETKLFVSSMLLYTSFMVLAFSYKQTKQGTTLVFVEQSGYLYLMPEPSAGTSWLPVKWP